MSAHSSKVIFWGKYIFFSLILLVALIVLTTMPRLAIPLAISYVAYLVLDPLIPSLMKFKIKREYAIAIIFITILLIFLIPIFKLIPLVKDDARDIQKYVPIVEDYLRMHYKKLTEFVYAQSGYQLSDETLINLIGKGKQLSAKLLVSLPELLGTILELVFVVPLFLFFMMKDGRAFKKFLVELIPNQIFERVYYISAQFNKKIGDYIFAKIIEAGFVSLIIVIGLLLMNVPFAIVLGIVAGVTNVIPYLGPVLGMLPAIVIGVVEYGPTTTLWAILILYLVANVIDMAFVFPILVSKIVDLHPIVVVIAVILGSQSLGVVGMVISIPVAVAIKLILSQIYQELYSSIDRR